MGPPGPSVPGPDAGRPGRSTLARPAGVLDFEFVR